LRGCFATVEAETKGLDNQLQQAEKSFGRTADFIKAHPVAAAGALGAALLGVGIKATQMAGEVDAAMRDVVNAVPGAAGAMEGLKDTVRALSDEFGISQVEIAGVMKELARTGIETAAELEAAARATLTAQKASGESREAIIKGLDAALDSFSLSGAESTRVLAELLAAAKGKTNLEDLGAALVRIGPDAKAAGFDLATTAAAIANVQKEVPNAKDQIKLLKAALEEGGTAFRDLAGPAIDTNAALADMQGRADLAMGSLSGVSDQIKTRLNNLLIEFGEVALPVAIKGLEALNAILALFSGELDKIRENAASQSIDAILTSLDKLKPEQVNARKQALQDLGVALRDLSGAESTGSRFISVFDEIAEAVKEGLGERSTADVLRLRDGLAKVLETGDLTAAELKRVKDALFLLNAEAAKRKDLPIVEAPPPEVKTKLDALRDALKAVGDRQREGKAAAKDYAAETKILTERQQALTEITNALKTEEAELLGDARRGIEKLREEMILAGGNVEAVDGLLRPLMTKLEEIEKRKISEPLRLAKEEAKKLDEAAKPVVLTIKDMAAAALKVDENVGDIVQPMKDVGLSADATKDAVHAIIAEGIAVAEQFGLIDGKAAAALQHTIDLGIQLSNLTSGNILESLPGIIGSLSGILGSLFSGKSPEELARKALIQRNIDALRENTATLLSTASPGFAVAGSRKGLADLFAGIEAKGFQGIGTRSQIAATDVAVALRPFGVTLSDLDRLFKDSGLTGDLRTKSGTFDAGLLRQLFEFLQQDLTKFGDTFQEQMERIRIGLDTGVIKPADEVAEIRKGLRKVRGGEPSVLTEALGGLDLTQKGLRDIAVKRLQGLVANIEDLTDEQLGGLNASQFLSVVSRLIGILTSDQLNPPRTPPPPPPPPPEPPPGGPGDPTIPPPPDFAVVDEISAQTDDFAAALDEGFADLVSVGDITNDLLEQILGTLKFTPVAPPVLPASLLGPGTATGAGTVINVGPIQVAVTLTGAAATNPTAAGQAIGEAIEQQLDQMLATRYRAQQKALGSAARTI